MSRTYNERSVPVQRGRRGEMKAKRRAHKRARQCDDIQTALALYKTGMIDRETPQSNRGKGLV